MVAPGISEALVATAVGLFAAIPAVVACQPLRRSGDAARVRFDGFIEELSTIVKRHAGRVSGVPRPRPRSAERGTHDTRTAADGEINVVPYIDNMLVLLTSFS